MVYFALSCVLAAVVLGVGEYMRRRFGYGNETSRKLVHIVHGVLVAYWPFILGYKFVIAVEVLFIFSVFVVQELRWFRWMWRVGRRSWGQFFYPVGVIMAALTAGSKWIYLAAVLELALADAAAALVGKKFGVGHYYKVIGQRKSVAGSLAFFVVSLIILGTVISLSPFHPAHATFVTALGLSALLVVVENIGVYGLDNFLLPFVTVIALNILR